MPETICFFTSIDKSGNEFNISLEASSINVQQVNVLLKVNDNSNTNTSLEIPIQVDLAQDKFSLPALTFSAGKFATCLILCNLPDLIQEITKCLQNCKSQNNNSQCLISCLKANGHKITPPLAKCATKCATMSVL